ncbi:hypothetical protein G9A89_018873 [Geosiphon pyriformis]|nr:hypothetical protein G9A89_018873 [Geosiphon pyriformis]
MPTQKEEDKEQQYKGYWKLILYQPSSIQLATDKKKVDLEKPTTFKINVSSSDQRKNVCDDEKIMGPVVTIDDEIIPPKPAFPDNCCMSGCAHCVLDIYAEEFREWWEATDNIRKRLIKENKPIPPILSDQKESKSHIKATTSSTTPKKKAPKSAFHGPTGGFFSQKKKMVFGNVKHSEDKKDISLNKSGSSGSVYSNVKSLFGKNKDVNMSGVNGGSLVGLTTTTPKTKQVNTGAGFGFPLSFPNFHMDDDKVMLPFRLPISLDKKWIDPKIIKTFVKVLIKKSFALDINLSAMDSKLATAKTQLIRKIFLTVNGFGGAITPSKFEGIIRLMFTSEESIEVTISLAREKGININSNLKKQKMRSDWAVMIKEILIDTSKKMIIAAVVEFAELEQTKQLAFRWSFLIGKDSVHMVMAMRDWNTWMSRDCFRALLFTLPVGTTAHDFGVLLEEAGGKTCVINCSLEIGNRIHCAVIGFESEDGLKSAFHTELIFGNMRLSWTRMDLVHCEKYGCLEHSVLECVASLAKLYAKKCVFIFHPATFGGKSWAQVVLLVYSPGGFHSDSSPGSSFSNALGINDSILSVFANNSFLGARLATVEHFLELLADQVSGMMQKLNDIVLTAQAPPLSLHELNTSMDDGLGLSSDMVLDGPELMLPSFAPIVSNVSSLDPSSSKVLTIKFDDIWIFTSGLNKGFLGAEVAIIVNNSLIHHVSKVEEISGHVISIRLLFKGKLSVTVLGLYASASAETKFGQAANVNAFIARAVNSSTFVVLGGNFNKSNSKKSVTFKFCVNLGLFNLLCEHLLAKSPTWSNSKSVEQVIDFIFVTQSLMSAIAGYKVEFVSEFFNTDHRSVSVSVDLGGLLDVSLNSKRKQANKDK